MCSAEWHERLGTDSHLHRSADKGHSPMGDARPDEPGGVQDSPASRAPQGRNQERPRSADVGEWVAPRRAETAGGEDVGSPGPFRYRGSTRAVCPVISREPADRCRRPTCRAAQPLPQRLPPLWGPCGFLQHPRSRFCAQEPSLLRIHVSKGTPRKTPVRVVHTHTGVTVKAKRHPRGHQRRRPA